MTGVVVAFKDCRLDDISVDVDAVVYDSLFGGLDDDLIREQFSLFQPDDALTFFERLDTQLSRVDRIHVERMQDPVAVGQGSGVIMQDSAVCGNLFAVDIDLLHRKVDQVAQYHQISVITGRYSAVILQTEVTRRVERAHLYRVHRADALLHRFADDRVHVTLVQQILRMSVIGTKQRAITVRRITKGEKRVQIFRGGTLTDHDPLSSR